jgi:hypothetical protein
MNIPSGSTELGLDLEPDCRRRLRGRSSRWVTSKKEAAPHLSVQSGAKFTLPLLHYAQGGARKYFKSLGRD